ncbi:MAG: glycosyltransferase [Aquificaceae bacterium]
MKLADVTPYYHKKSGGVRRYLFEKSRFLSSTDISHILIVPGSTYSETKEGNTTIYTVRSIPLPLSGGYRMFHTLSEVKSILRRESPEILELGGSYQRIDSLVSNNYLLSVFYHADLRTELSLLPVPKKIKKALLFNWIKKLSKADLVLTPSKKQEEFLKSYGLERVYTVNLGVDSSIFNPFQKDPDFRKNIHIPEDKALLLYVGRLSVEKGLLTLLKFFKQLDKKLFHLVIVGDGPLRSWVLRASKKLPNLTYLEYVGSNLDLARIYASCDIFVSASPLETYGLSFLEAQSCGCVLVSLDMGLETQPFKQFLAKDLSESAFLEAIWRAKNALSQELRMSISNYIRHHFSWDQTFKNLVSLYSNALARA